MKITHQLNHSLLFMTSTISVEFGDSCELVKNCKKFKTFKSHVLCPSEISESLQKFYGIRLFNLKKYIFQANSLEENNPY